MFSSFGDKYDLPKHDESLNPRKIKTNNLALLVLLPLFICNCAFSFIGPSNIEESTLIMVNKIILLVMVVSYLLLYLLKRQINKENDTLLLLFGGVFVFVLFALFLFS
jgi:cytochrome bd-type quinol oxidase subunit 2